MNSLYKQLMAEKGPPQAAPAPNSYQLRSAPMNLRSAMQKYAMGGDIEQTSNGITPEQQAAILASLENRPQGAMGTGVSNPAALLASLGNMDELKYMERKKNSMPVIEDIPEDVPFTQPDPQTDTGEIDFMPRFSVEPDYPGPVETPEAKFGGNTGMVSVLAKLLGSQGGAGVLQNQDQLMKLLQMLKGSGK